MPAPAPTSTAVKMRGPTRRRASETAVENAVALEAVAASTYRALVLHSGCVSIDDRLLAKHFDRKHGPGAYYGQPT